MLLLNQDHNLLTIYILAWLIQFAFGWCKFAQQRIEDLGLLKLGGWSTSPYFNRDSDWNDIGGVLIEFMWHKWHNQREGKITSQNIEINFLWLIVTQSHIADIVKWRTKGKKLNQNNKQIHPDYPVKPFQITLRPFQLGCFKKTGMIEELLIEFIVTQMSAALHRFDRHNYFSK